jgi:S1-C subfamily serine protease
MRTTKQFMLLILALSFCLTQNENAVLAANQKSDVDKPDLSFLAMPQEKTPLLDDEVNNIKVYKKCSKAVVNIATVATPEGYYYNIVPQEGIGSGTIISEDGYIITNEHVVGNNNVVRVTLHDGSSYAAKLVGKDSSNALAVLKIDAPKSKKFQYVPIGDSSELAVGRRVLAIGNPFGYDQTMTQGMISSLGRTLTTRNNRMVKGIIQTDAAINPGNSGVCDHRGLPIV